MPFVKFELEVEPTTLATEPVSTELAILVFLPSPFYSEALLH